MTAVFQPVPSPFPQPTIIKLGQRWQNKCHGSHPMCDGVIVRHFGGTLWEMARETWEEGHLEQHNMLASADLVGIVSEKFLWERCVYVGECDWFIRALGACSDPTHRACVDEAQIARDCFLTRQP